MLGSVNDIVQHLLHWRFWQQFRLVDAMPASSGSVFEFAQYLASLALFMVVMTASDFRYRYRLSLTRMDLRRVGFWIAFGIGITFWLTDVWFQNHLPLPKLISNENDIKAGLGLLFLLFVFWLIAIAVISPPGFGTSNAEKFFSAHYQFVHQEILTVCRSWQKSCHDQSEKSSRLQLALAPRIRRVN